MTSGSVASKAARAPSRCDERSGLTALAVRESLWLRGVTKGVPYAQNNGPQQLVDLCGSDCSKWL